MRAAQAADRIQEHLMTDESGFEVVRDLQLPGMTVPLFAKRRAGMGGTDFLFVHDADRLPGDAESLRKYHEEARSYAGSFFRMPKAFRFRIPSIMSVFLRTGGLTDEIKSWAQELTRTMRGGEFHSVFIIDTEAGEAYGQGTSRVFVMVRGMVGFHMQFREIDPQNRSHGLIRGICAALFEDGGLPQQ